MSKDNRDMLLDWIKKKKDWKSVLESYNFLIVVIQVKVKFFVHFSNTSILLLQSVCIASTFCFS